MTYDIIAQIDAEFATQDNDDRDELAQYADDLAELNVA